MDSQGYGILKKEDKKKQMVCNFCHIPYKKKAARIWDELPPSLNYWGRVGSICYSCHDGVVVVNPDVDASMTAYHPESHGLSIRDLPKDDDTSESGLPYTGGSIDENITCTSCHNPHENDIRPFARAALNELCQKCHQRRENSGYERENIEGTHPVHKKPLDEVVNPSPIDVDDDFKTIFPEDYPSEDGKETLGVHWTLGGHLSEGDDGLIECITCHAVHGKERTGPVTDYRLLSKNPVMVMSNDFCEGCHKGKRGDDLGEPPYPNPGGTEIGRTYHPADNDIANGEDRIVSITQPEGWKFGNGGEVLCNTCHKAHDAIPNSPMLRPTIESSTFCEECHNDQAFSQSHHPSGDMSGGFASINSGKPHADTRVVVIPDGVWERGVTYGTPEDGKIYCSSCHRAHNAPCIPILVFDCEEGGGACDICYECHPKFNPTWQTDDDWKATHFIGDPSLSVIDRLDITTGEPFGTQPGYFDQYPPIYEDMWPDSGEYSRYDGESGNGINCCSCHSFSKEGITSGDADYTPHLGPVLASGYQPEDLTAGLLAPAGKWKEWLEDEVIDFDLGGERGTVQRAPTYLCTGCHGLNPNTLPGQGVVGEGFTHALMDADGTKWPIDPDEEVITYTYRDHINCESCHSPHEADSRSGFYILREAELNNNFGSSTSAGSGTPVSDPYVIRQRGEIEFAPICHKCHLNY
jgi:predicted CXXCH cytochrome family protein